MPDWKEISSSILTDFFKQTRKYVGSVLASGESYMDGLNKYCQEAWAIPKDFKGNSSNMGFVPELLIFEALKQKLEEKYQIILKPKVRKQTAEKTETCYFVDKADNPCRLLVQGLRIAKGEDLSGALPPTSYAHDITYLIKGITWKVKSVVEVKGFFDVTSLTADLNKLMHAETNYQKTEDYVFAFVGFSTNEPLSESVRKALIRFVGRKNSFLILSGPKNPEIRNSTLNEFFDKL